ncbi:MAG: histidine phosphatase family protein [Ilumatobacteraceae bacterium]
MLLIRHARSDDVVPGSEESADPPLHPLGREQAAKLATRLQAKTLHAVFSSHLARARQTALPLAERHGLEIQIFPDLEEARLGDWSNGEFRRRAATLDPEWVAWSKTGRWDGIPGGEGDEALRLRVAGVIDGLAATHAGQCIAVVTHGGAIGAYLAHLFGIHRSIWLAVENTSITKIVLGANGAAVITANDCNHLYDSVLGPN